MTAFAFDLMFSLVDYHRYFVLARLSSSREVLARVRAYHEEGSIALPTNCVECAIKFVNPAHCGV
jgi:hypothetical protein